MSNLSNLSQSERDTIELQRQASLWINKLKHGKATRFDITQAIESKPDNKREEFRSLLNKYKTAV